jgi:hypothetical protein
VVIPARSAKLAVRLKEAIAICVYHGLIPTEPSTYFRSVFGRMCRVQTGAGRRRAVASSKAD